MAGQKGRSGRKKKDTENKASTNAIRAIVSKFGGEKEAFEKLAELAKGGSYNHFKLLLEYAYGQPQKHVDLTSGGNEIKIPNFIIESE